MKRGVLLLLCLAYVLMAQMATTSSTSSGFGFLQVFGGLGPDVAYDIAYSDGYVYVVGYTMSYTDSPNGCGFIYVINVAGDYIDLKVYCAMVYGYEELTDIVTKDGDLYVVGNLRYLRRDTQDFEYDMIIARISREGGLVWGIVIGQQGVAEMASSITVVDNYLYITGAMDRDVLVVKLSLDGNVAWSKTIDLGYIDKGVSIRAFRGELYILAQSFNDDHGYYMNYLIKLDYNGNIVRAVSLDPNHYHSSLQVSSTGEIYLGGWIIDYNTKTTIAFIKKLNTNLGLVWSRRFPSSLGSSLVYDIAIDEKGYVYATGTNAGDAFIFKLTPFGTTLWTKFLRNSSGYDELYGLVVARDVVYATGVTKTWTKTPYYPAIMVMAVTDDFRNDYIESTKITLEQFKANSKIESLTPPADQSLGKNAELSSVVSWNDRFKPLIIFQEGTPPTITGAPSIPPSTITHFVTTTMTKEYTVTMNFTITKTEVTRETVTKTIYVTHTPSWENSTITETVTIEYTMQPVERFARSIAELIEILIVTVLLLGGIAILVYLINLLSKLFKKT